MITIKIYKNGYEITGHTFPNICSEVSFWHYITSNLILGWDTTDKKAKEYSSDRDNKENPHEGYSWVTFSKFNTWIFDDCIVSLKRWAEAYWKDCVSIMQVDEELVK